MREIKHKYMCAQSTKYIDELSENSLDCKLHYAILILLNYSLMSIFLRDTLRNVPL